MFVWVVMQASIRIQQARTHVMTVHYTAAAHLPARELLIVPVTKEQHIQFSTLGLRKIAAYASAEPTRTLWAPHPARLARLDCYGHY